VTQPLDIRRNEASADAIERLLLACDRDFDPPLSSRVEIKAYAHRLHTKAERFELFEASALVGLVAIYCNDPTGQAAFVSNVSVAQRRRGQGIADALLTETLAYATVQGFAMITLEVGPLATAAQALYLKHGFKMKVRGAETHVYCRDL